jgi:hypothetical protein
VLDWQALWGLIAWCIGWGACIVVVLHYAEWIESII